MMTEPIDFHRMTHIPRVLDYPYEPEQEQHDYCPIGPTRSGVFTALVLCLASAGFMAWICWQIVQAAAVRVAWL